MLLRHDDDMALGGGLVGPQTQERARCQSRCDRSHLSDGFGITGTDPVLLGLSVEAVIDETPQWMTATGGKSVSGAGGPASSSTNLN
jgi:hypothetical protein